MIRRFSLFFAFKTLFSRSGSGAFRHIRGAIIGAAISIIPLVVVLEIADGMMQGIVERYMEISSFHMQVTLTNPDAVEKEEELLEKITDCKASLHNPSTDQVRASTCHKILLIEIQMPTNFSGSLVPAAKVKSLNSKTKLLIILGIYQKHQSQFNC